MRSLTRGARGEAVHDVRARLAALGFTTESDEPGSFGARTEAAVREFQQRRHLLVDGKVGPDTWHELVEAGYSLGDRVLYNRYPSLRGDDVRALQARLNLLGFDVGKEDGIFGERSDHAVREFQRNVGLPSDGIVGATTLQALLRLRPISPGPGFGTVRERESLRRMAVVSLHGRRIAVDAGHGPSDPGGIGPSGLQEASVALDLAGALCSELRERGGEPILLRGAAEDPTVSERARSANQAGADVLVTLHLNTLASGEGATVFY